MLCKSISLISIYFFATSVPLKHMAPHLTRTERDTLMDWRQKFTPIQIHYKLQRLRARRNIACPDLTAVRKFLKGKTHRRGAIETRGAKSKWTRAHVSATNRERRKRNKAIKGTRFIKWDKITKGARLLKVHRTTAAQAFIREGIPAKYRPSREKPDRTQEHDEERAKLCGKMRKWPVEKFTDELDMIMDCKQWEAALTPEGRNHQAKQAVHGQIRTPAEGLEADSSKANKKKHRKSVGGYVRVLAGISNSRIVLLEYYKR